MTARFNLWRLPEPPITPPHYNLPEPVTPHLSNDQIHQRVHDCLTGGKREAFTKDTHYWYESVTEWEEEYMQKNGAACAVCIDLARDRMAHVETMMLIHARELLDEMNEDQLMDEGIQP